ncbi:MAG: rod shape-determining protein MreD [Lachnospiraceae bacterium]|nr:rod shape-determining protein MreD [Lachnospiraceae bacterium]
MIKRKAASVLIILIAFVLQTTVFQALALAEVVPNLLLVVTVCYAYLRGRTSGLINGFFCGLLMDMVYGSVVGLYAFIFMSIGFAVGFCRKIYFTDRLILPAVLITGSDLVYGIYYYVMEFLMRGRMNLGFYFLRVILPEVIYTALVGILVYRLLAALEPFFSPQRKEA